MLEQALERARAGWDGDLKQFQEELRFASIGTSPDFRQATEDNAEWLADQFRQIGCEARLWGHEHGNPMVFAEWKGAPGAPTINIYGHYDVQPPDPLELWESPPFEPTIRGSRIYARGSADSKVNHFAGLRAAAYAIAAGGPPVNLRFLIEGEEEGGGEVLPRFIDEHLADLGGDAVLIWDGGFDYDGRAALCVGLRGIIYTEIHAQGARVDLHSGEFGGASPNPINTLAHVLAGLKDKDGRILIPGFYDKVRPPTEAEVEEWRQLTGLEAWVGETVGARALEGEPDWSLAERMQVRPTLDSNGIWGGYTEPGGEKTVIPAHAVAKVSMRLVPDQDPNEIFDAIAAFAPTLSTPGVEIEVRRLSAGAPPVLIGADHAPARTASRAYEAAFGSRPRLVRSGGSIPVAIDLAKLGQPMVCSGFPQADCAVHSPNESCEIDHLKRGIEMLIHYFWTLPEELGKA